MNKELMYIFNKRDLWISSSIIFGILASVIAILVPITSGNELVPHSVLFSAIGACLLLMVISLARWHSWNKRALEGIGTRDWMRSSI